MRFMTLVKSAEPDGPPPQSLMAAIGKLGEETELHRQHWRGREGETEVRQVFGQ